MYVTRLGGGGGWFGPAWTWDWTWIGLDWLVGIFSDLAIFFFFFFCACDISHLSGQQRATSSARMGGCSTRVLTYMRAAQFRCADGPHREERWNARTVSSGWLETGGALSLWFCRMYAFVAASVFAATPRPSRRPSSVRRPSVVRPFRRRGSAPLRVEGGRRPVVIDRPRARPPAPTRSTRSPTRRIRNSSSRSQRCDM